MAETPYHGKHGLSLVLRADFNGMAMLRCVMLSFMVPFMFQKNVLNTMLLAEVGDALQYHKISQPANQSYGRWRTCDVTTPTHHG